MLLTIGAQEAAVALADRPERGELQDDAEHGAADRPPDQRDERSDMENR